MTKFLSTSLESLYCQEYSNKSKSNTISTIDIVVGSDHGQEKFRSVCKFILRYMSVIYINSYVIKNAHTYYEKDTYEVLNDSVVKLFNNEIKIIMNEDIFVYFMWNEDKKLMAKYSKS